MSHVVFQFGEFVIDPAARELWQTSQRIALPPKSFECLAYLLEHRERAVGRDELISAVWGRVDVSDAVLAQTLLRARRAVGDTGAEQTTIRTVPRFGYRWIAAVHSIESSNVVEGRPESVATRAPAVTDAAITDESLSAPTSNAEKAAPSPSVAAADTARTTTPFPARLRNAWWLLATAAIAAVIAGIVLSRRTPPVGEPMQAGNVLAVLPVTVSNPTAESSWIRLGAMDYVAARLRESAKLAVLPSDQIVTLVGDAGGDEALARVSRATAAKWLVQPHAEQTPKGWQIQLIVRRDGATHEAVATGATPLEAAEQASERLLSLLDIPHGSSGSDKAAPGPLTELVQRVDAALLAGDTTEARRLIDAAPAEQRADPALRVREGQLQFRAGRIDEAERLFAPIAQSSTPLPVDVQTQAMMGLGAVAVRRNDFPLAEKRYAEALAVLGDHGDPNLVGNAYNGRGVARTAQHLYDLALADLGRARVALERAGNQLDAASTDANLALTESVRKRYAQALPHFDSAIAVHERFGVRDNLASDLLNKAHAQQQLLDIEGARASSTRAFELSLDLENPILVHSIDVTQANVLLAVGRLRDAAAVLAKLPAGSNGDDGDASDVAAARARIALAAGDSAGALAILKPLVSDKPASRIAVLPVFVRAALGAGQKEVAGTVLDRVVDEPSSPEDRLSLELARGLLDAGSDNAAQAEKHFVAAQALADASGVPAERARSGSAYADFLIDQHELDKASAVVGDLAAYADRDFDVAQATIDLYHALGDASLEAAARGRAKTIAGERKLIER
jgi:DNA-binding winged helix-turn-helix (wHTH) protein/tetratricopeptide (TPR) repeat protein